MKPLHLLIIDDDKAVLEMLTDWFAVYQNHRVYPARTSDEALDHMQQHAIDAIITDINHPGIDGLTLTRLLKEFGGPPVIITSGCGHYDSPRQAYANGAHAFLRKPCNLEEIRNAVDLVVNKGMYYIGRRADRSHTNHNSKAAW